MLRPDLEMPRIPDPRLAPEHRPWIAEHLRPKRSTDAVANALHDIRIALADLADRVTGLEDNTSDDDGLGADFRALEARVDDIENQLET